MAPPEDGEAAARPAAMPLSSREDIARAARLSSNTISQIEKIQKTAAPELVEAVRSGTISINAVGPGQSIAEYHDITHVVQNQQLTPIDSEHCHLRWQLYHVPGMSEGKMRVTAARMRDLVKQVNQDIPIWNSKIYCKQPLLVQGDGPVLAYRREYQKFYDFDDAASNDTVA